RARHARTPCESNDGRNGLAHISANLSVTSRPRATAPGVRTVPLRAARRGSGPGPFCTVSGTASCPAVACRRASSATKIGLPPVRWYYDSRRDPSDGGGELAPPPVGRG